jgi:hypothetical protein
VGGPSGTPDEAEDGHFFVSNATSQPITTFPIQKVIFIDYQ